MSTGPSSSASAPIAMPSLTSRRRVATKASARSANLSSATSVASTFAPSAAKASAAARPIPCAAAVTRARLPSSLPVMPPRHAVLVGGWLPVDGAKLPCRESLCKSPRRISWGSLCANKSPSPRPSPRKRGEGELTALRSTAVEVLIKGSPLRSLSPSHGERDRVRGNSYGQARGKGPSSANRILRAIGWSDASRERPAEDPPMRHRAIWPLCLFLLLLCFAPLCRAAEPGSDTAQKLFLWKVSGPAGTVYLFGTIHVGRTDFYPLAPVIEASFKAADTLITEADLIESGDTDRLLKILLQKGTYPAGDSVENHIGQETRAHLLPYVEATQELASSYTRLKPWFLSIAITVIKAKRMGLNANDGLDRHFVDQATEMHKPIATLETAESQLELLNSF